MPIIKTTALDNGLPLGYHVVRRVVWTAGRDADRCVCMIDSWLSEAIWRAGGNPAHTQVVDLAMVGSLTPVLAAEAELVSSVGVLSGGLVVVPTVGGDLAAAKQRARAKINVERDRRIVLPKPTTIGTFDAAPLNLANLAQVADATSLKVAAGRTGLDAKSRYTLADDTRPRLSLAQLQAAQLEIADAVESLYDTAQELRANINSATTIQEVDAISWP